MIRRLKVNSPSFPPFPPPPPVSDYVVHHLSVPVMVIKGEEGALPQGEASHAVGAAAAAAAEAK